jgi:predicted nucleotidyltransferase
LVYCCLIISEVSRREKQVSDPLAHARAGTANLYGNTDKGKDLYGMATDKEILEFIAGYGVKPLFLCVTGSHMWNLAEPNSDLDIRGIYQKPTEIILSLHKGADTIEACDVLRKDIDIQLYEVEKAFNMLQSHNGNVVEMLLSPTRFYQTLDVDWQGIAKRYLTKRLAHYYKGYYHSQRQRAMKNRGGRAVAYTFREIYQGIWLMRNHGLEYDFKKLRDEFEKEFKPSENLEKFMNRETWNTPLSEDEIREFEKEWEMLLAMFEREYRTSSLAEDYDGYSILNEELLALREKELHDHRRNYQPTSPRVADEKDSQLPGGERLDRGLQHLSENSDSVTKGNIQK